MGGGTPSGMDDRSTPPPLAPPTTETKLRILVVEDDEMLRAVLVEVVEGLGYAVCATAASESEAVAAAAATKPDLMIVDIGLGRGSGVAAVERILQTGPVPHFFITGVRPEYLSNDAPVLRKPFRAAQLAASIEAALKRP